MNTLSEKVNQTPIKGLTTVLPSQEVSYIPKNPFMRGGGDSVPLGEISQIEVTLGAAPFFVSLPVHEHLILDNQGLQTIQYSKDDASWFDFLPSGIKIVMDGHKEQSFYLRSAAGACVVLLTTW